jgi:hypothetical protein
MESGRFFARVKRREKEESDTCAESEHKNVAKELTRNVFADKE